MSYSDITRLAGNLSSESLQSLRKTNRNSNAAAARQNETDKTSAGNSSAEVSFSAELSRQEASSNLEGSSHPGVPSRLADSNISEVLLRADIQRIYPDGFGNSANDDAGNYSGGYPSAGINGFPAGNTARIRSPELAAGVVGDISQQIMANTTEALLAQANLGPQTLIRLQR